MKKDLVPILAVLPLLAFTPPAFAETEPAAVGPIPPDVSVNIEMSSSDVNRIVCHSKIKDVIFSQDKGIEVKIIEKNAFVKYRIQKREEKNLYTKTPSEFYVVCGGEVYSLVAAPKRIPPQTITLAPGKRAHLKKNLGLYADLPLEKKVIRMIKSMATGDLPESFTVTKKKKELRLFKDLNVTLIRTVALEGEGLRGKEFIVRLKESITAPYGIPVKEVHFLKKELAERPLGIAVDKQTVESGKQVRVFIVERVSDEP